MAMKKVRCALLKLRQQVCNSSLVSYSSMPFIHHYLHHTSFVSMDLYASSSSTTLGFSRLWCFKLLIPLQEDVFSTCQRASPGLLQT